MNRGNFAPKDTVFRYDEERIMTRLRLYMIKTGEVAVILEIVGEWPHSSFSVVDRDGDFGSRLACPTTLTKCRSY